MNVELYKSKDNNHNKLVLEVGGMPRTIIFKSGGSIDDPRTSTSVAGGGHITEGLYDETLCEGVATISQDLLSWLIQAYAEGKVTLTNSAIHKAFSTTEGITIVTRFKQVMLKKLPKIEIGEMGGEVTVTMSFSLNAMDGIEVQQ